MALADEMQKMFENKAGIKNRESLSSKLKKHFEELPKKTAENIANTNYMVQNAMPYNPQTGQFDTGPTFSEFANYVPNLMGATAFHGTPHEIQGAFSALKGGSGSGTLNFGHGTYFAESPEVAGLYKMARNRTPENITGNLYKVDIPDEHIPKMLDWYEDVPEDIRSKISSKAMEQFGSGISPTTGEKLYKEIAFSLKQAGSKTPEADASKWLLEQGIPGIKYENMQMVKGQGLNTNNYVVFDPKNVSILEKNGKPVERFQAHENRFESPIDLDIK